MSLEKHDEFNVLELIQYLDILFSFTLNSISYKDHFIWLTLIKLQPGNTSNTETLASYLCAWNRFISNYLFYSFILKLSKTFHLRYYTPMWWNSRQKSPFYPCFSRVYNNICKQTKTIATIHHLLTI